MISASERRHCSFDVDVENSTQPESAHQLRKHMAFAALESELLAHHNCELIRILLGIDSGLREAYKRCQEAYY